MARVFSRALQELLGDFIHGATTGLVVYASQPSVQACPACPACTCAPSLSCSGTHQGPAGVPSPGREGASAGVSLPLALGVALVAAAAGWLLRGGLPRVRESPPPSPGTVQLEALDLGERARAEALAVRSRRRKA